MPSYRKYQLNIVARTIDDIAFESFPTAKHTPAHIDYTRDIAETVGLENNFDKAEELGAWVFADTESIDEDTVILTFDMYFPDQQSYNDFTSFVDANIEESGRPSVLAPSSDPRSGIKYIGLIDFNKPYRS